MHGWYYMELTDIVLCDLISKGFRNYTDFSFIGNITSLISRAAFCDGCISLDTSYGLRKKAGATVKNLHNVFWALTSKLKKPPATMISLPNNPVNQEIDIHESKFLIQKFGYQALQDFQETYS
jgi:hypothetical protein